MTSLCKVCLAVYLIVGATAQTPPAPKRTDLTDHEKVQLWEEFGKLNELLQERQQLEGKIQLAGSAFEAKLEDHRKVHNAIGCALDFKTMHWGVCTPPAKDSVKK